MALHCKKCNHIISDKQYLSCSTCNYSYHLKCTNVSCQRFYNTLTPIKRAKWICKTCRERPQKINRTDFDVSSQKNVTERKKYIINISTDNSFLSLEDSEDIEHVALHSTLDPNRSCPENKFNVREELEEMKANIFSLKEKLEIADNEIENLLLENSKLKKENSLHILKIDKLTRICRSTPQTSANKIDCTTKSSTSLERRSLNKRILDFSRTENDDQIVKTISYKQNLESLRVIDQQNNVIATNNSKLEDRQIIDTPLRNDLAGAETQTGNSGYSELGTTTNIQGTIDEIRTDKSNSKDSNSEQKDKSVSVTEKHVKKDNSSATLKHRVILLADETGRNLRENLEALIGNDYLVTSTIKPNAPLDVVLDGNMSFCKGLTKQDYVIILAGRHDYDSIKFQSTVRTCFDQLANTNVIFGRLLNNFTLKRTRINEILALAASNYANVHLSELIYFRNILDRVNTCRALIRDIIMLHYKIKYTMCHKHSNSARAKHVSVQTEDRFFRD